MNYQGFFMTMGEMNILIIAQGGYGGHYVKDRLEKDLQNVKVAMCKKEEFNSEDVKNYHIIIIAGYSEITESRRIMIYKNKNVVLPDIAIFRNCTLCNHSRFLEFIHHPWP